MAKKGNISRMSLDDARKAVTEGRTLTDWARVDAMSEGERDAAIRSDPDEGEAHLDLDWSKAIPGLPPRKEMVNMRLDREVLDWFRSGGKGYQSRINAVLNSYVRSQTRGRAA
jgi:uncharacterized protein (DUF4415 family)